MPGTFSCLSGRHAGRNYKITYLLFLIILPSCNLFYFPDASGIITNPSKRNQLITDQDPIFIKFDFDVDKSSVEDIFTVKNIDALQGYYTWSKNTVFFHPFTAYIFGYRYILSCSGKIEDVNGIPYNLNIEVPFYFGSRNTLPPVISEIYTSTGTSTILANSTITIVFSKSIIPSSLINGFSLTPDIDYNIAWNMTTTIPNTIVAISPVDHWNNHQQYTISLSTNIKDTQSIPIAQSAQFYFFVNQDNDNPGIESILPVVNDWENNFPYTGLSMEGVKYNDDIKIIFSENMDKEKTERALNFLPNLSHTTVWIDDTTMIIIPESGYQMDKEYTIVIDSTAEDQFGNCLQPTFYCIFTADIPQIFISSMVIAGVEANFSSNTPITIITPDQDLVSVTIIFNSSKPITEGIFSTTQDRLSVQQSINIIPLFPSSLGGVTPVSYSWTSNNQLVILYTGFKPSIDPVSNYYFLKIKGGSTSFITSYGSFLPSDTSQLLLTGSL